MQLYMQTRSFFKKKKQQHTINKKKKMKGIPKKDQSLFLLCII